MADWTQRASRVVAYEHPEDGNIHCHILLMGVYDTSETLKNDMKKHGVPCSGPGQLSFKTTFKNPDKQVIDITEETAPKFITYMSKGKYDALYFTYYTQEFLDDCKSKWVVYKRRTAEQVLYDDFKKKLTGFEITNTPADIEFLRRIAVSTAKAKYCVINLGCRRDARMLMDTYLYESRLVPGDKITLPFD